MTDKFEQSIKEWYRTRTKNLEYLDLSDKNQPKSSEIANNLEVVYDKVCLLSKVSLKQFYQLKEENRSLKEEIASLRKSVSHLEKEVVSQKPLTKLEVKELVREIAQQPKLVEEEALKLTEELRRSVKKVEYLIKELQNQIGS